MDNEGCGRQTSIQFKCKKILPDAAKTEDPGCVAKEIIKNQDKEEPMSILASPTPQKPEWRSKAKGVTSYASREKHLSEGIGSGCIATQSQAVDPNNTSDEEYSDSVYCQERPLTLNRTPKDGHIELTHKYKILVDLFNGMESSVRLLRLRKKVPTFQNICTQVEILTKRKFLCSHLAQMKHLFPEAFLIEKIRIHDDKSLCMKPDMKITLVLDIVECLLDPDESASMALCKTFRSRLLEFINAHPKNSDIPEAMLPEPFNQEKHLGPLSKSPEEASVEVREQDSVVPVPSSSSHFPSSFRSQFSRKVIIPETRLTQLLASPTSIVSVEPDSEKNGFGKVPPRKDIISDSIIKSPAEVICTPSRGKNSNFPECTPVKFESNTTMLMGETPALPTPKRPMTTPLKNLVTEDEQSVIELKLSHSARRALIYSPSKTEVSFSEPVDCTIEQEEVTRHSSQSTAAKKRIMLGEEIGGSSTTKQDLAGAYTAGTEDTRSQATVGVRQEFQACLLSMFDTVHGISRSIDCSLITKQELVHKIIANNLDIEETSEVEEQLGLLEELVPEWICKKTISSGDFFYSIKRTSDPESIRARLVEAA